MRIILPLENEEEYENAKIKFANLERRFFNVPSDKRFFFSSGNPVLSTFQPIIDTMSQLANYEQLFQRYRSPNGLDSVKTDLLPFFSDLLKREDISPDNLIFGNSIMALFASLIRQILITPSDVVLIPVPSYGLLIDVLRRMQCNVVVIKLKENDGWKLQPGDLEAKIRSTNEKLKLLAEANHVTYVPKVRALLNINPHNPTGVVYDRYEIEKLSSVLMKFPEIFIIDDFAYFGTEYGQKKASPIAVIDNLYKRTVTLVGTSKALSATALRIAIACGPTELLRQIKEDVLYSQTFVNTISQIALKAAYSSDPLILDQRAQFFKSIAKSYEYRGTLLRALIYGINSISPTFLKIKIIQDVNRVLGNETSKYVYGIPYVKLRCTPEASYFNLIDFSEWIKFIPCSLELKTSMDVCELLMNRLNMLMIPGELMQCDGLACLLRISYTLPINEIILGMKSLFDLTHVLIPNQDHSTGLDMDCGYRSFQKNALCPRL